MADGEDVLFLSAASPLLSSGFEFNDELIHLGIQKDDWSQFTAELAGVVHKERREFLLAATSGLLVGLTYIMIAGPLGPLLGYATYQSARASLEEERLFNEAGVLELLDSVLCYWNSTYFVPKNLVARLDIPDRKRCEETSFKRLVARQRRPKQTDSVTVTAESGRNIVWIADLDKPRIVLLPTHDRIKNSMPPKS